MKKVIDITDWAEETDAHDPKFRDVHSAYAEGADRGMTVRALSRIAYIQQERSLLDEQIFDPTGKHELGEGVYRTFRGKSPVASLMRENPSGESEAIAQYKEYQSSESDGIVLGDSEAGTEAAKHYLHKYCVSHVRRSLARIAANDGDVLGEAEELCEEIMTVARMLEVRVLV